MTIQENISLRDISIFKTGGVAQYYCSCTSLAEIIDAVEQAKELKVPYRVIGASSSCLMSDSGYPGMIIHNKTASQFFLHDRSQLIVDSGVLLHQLVNQTVSLGYSGLEFLVGFPGTVGGAIYANISDLGFHFGDYVKSATILFPTASGSESIRRVDREWFEFSESMSRLKQDQQDLSHESSPVLLSITLQLSKMPQSSCVKRMHEYLHLRHKLTPSVPHKLCVFNNLRIKGEDYPPDKLSSRKQLDRQLYYIDRSTIRQSRKGEISCFAANPNFFINSGTGTSRDAAELIEKIQTTVSDESRQLNCRIEYVGLWE